MSHVLDSGQESWLAHRIAVEIHAAVAAERERLVREWSAVCERSAEELIALADTHFAAGKRERGNVLTGQAAGVRKAVGLVVANAEMVE